MMKGKKGFTLIELLIVVAIIGLLSAVVLVSLNSARRSANDARRKADLKQMANAIEMYYDTNSVYPTMTGDACSYAACGGVTCTTANWTSTKFQIATWLVTVPGDPVNNSVTSCYFAPAAKNTSTSFCLIAANLQVPNVGYYVAHNGSGLTAASPSTCPVL